MAISYQNYQGFERQRNYGVPPLENIAAQRPYSFAELNQLVYKALQDALKQGLQTIVEKSINLSNYIKEVLPPYSSGEPLSLTYFSKHANEKKREQSQRERGKEKQQKAMRMKNPSGGSRYARKSKEGNWRFWENNPFNKPPVQEEKKHDPYRSWRRFNSF